MIVDFHNHIGKRKGLSFTAEQLIEKMDEGGIDKAVVFTFPENIDNEYVYQATLKYPDRLIGFVTVNPWNDKCEEELEYYLSDGKLKGIKLHSLKHGFAFDSHTLLDPIFMIAEKYNVPIIAYGAANVLCVSNMFEEMARTFPKVNLIMAHAGQMYEAKGAIGCASRVSNLYLESSRCFAENIRKQLSDVGYQQMLLGTDVPFGEYDLEIAKIKMEVKDPEAQKAILGGNALRLLGGGEE